MILLLFVCSCSGTYDKKKKKKGKKKKKKKEAENVHYSSYWATICADYILIFFSQKMKLPPNGTICMKCQSLFSINLWSADLA